jgi:prepilin-type N-terminal cleavage/methylation domain-containing protein
VSTLRSKNGFTLLETLVVVAIVGVILLFAIPALYSMLQSYKVKATASQIAIQIRMARNLCVSQKTDYQVIIHSVDASSSPNTYLIQNRPGASYSTVPNLDTTVPASVKILSTGIFSGGIATLQFTPRGKVISALGTPPYLIEIEGVNQLRYQILIDPTGSVEVKEG